MSNFIRNALLLIVPLVLAYACQQDQSSVELKKTSIVRVKINKEVVGEEQVISAYFSIIEKATQSSRGEYTKHLQVALLDGPTEGVWYFKFGGSCMESIDNVHALLADTLPQILSQTLVATSSMECVDPRELDQLSLD